ncbi:MAG TPA: protein-glutamate O-methyltransferase CheR [Nannocystaceae bacterium]|nr:protein-glutamate O-methyltransferase CheR [Nannocystaceae bacterium]
MQGSEPGAKLTISAEETAALQAIVEGHCGVVAGLDSGFFLERRAGPRVQALGLTSFAAYCEYLRRPDEGPQELALLVEQLTTHETYFFRELFQLDAFRAEVLPALARARAGARRLTIWSAGTSTGEEAYTLAMILLESGLFAGWSLRVIGTDISRRVLSTARHGVFGPSSFRTTDDQLRDRYFERAQGDTYRVRDEVRALVHFRHLNLLDAGGVAGLGPVDAIFCRNVLMYMSTDARRRVVASFHDALFPGGYLFLGHSESLITLGTDFELVHLRRDLAYRRAP